MHYKAFLWQVTHNSQGRWRTGMDRTLHDNSARSYHLRQYSHGQWGKIHMTWFHFLLYATQSYWAHSKLFSRVFWVCKLNQWLINKIFKFWFIQHHYVYFLCKSELTSCETTSQSLDFGCLYAATHCNLASLLPIHLTDWI